MSDRMWRKADWNMCTPALRSETGEGAAEADVYWVQRCVSVNGSVWGCRRWGWRFQQPVRETALTVKVCFAFKLA